MEIWLDTCDESYIHSISPLGILEGVTTNPTILRGQSIQFILPALLKAQPGKVALQVTDADAESMFNQALQFHLISPRILIKVPTHTEGLKCMHRLAEKKIPFLATAIFTPLQSLLAFKVGAAYLAPYVGRAQDIGVDPLYLLKSMQSIKNVYGFKGKVLAASLRSLTLVETCSELGIEAVTLRPALLEEWLMSYSVPGTGYDIAHKLTVS